MHETLIVTKTRLFEIIEDGSLMKFFKEQNFDFQKKGKRKTKAK
jgi:hypothetical protein